jgi:serine/threonine-protein kinase RsbW
MTKTAERRIELTLTLPMIPDVEITAVKAVSDVAHELGMSDEAIDEISHALIEACINAREHSCCADQRIYLRFLGTLEDDDSPKVEIWITDHGRGFDPEQARQRRMVSPRGPKKRGWGLQIMEAHMDQVEIFSGSEGTTVHMVKHGERAEQ